MPDIKYTKEGGQITYDYRDWLGGVDFGGGVFDNGVLGNSLSFSSKADPLRYIGYISPGKRAVDVTTVSVVSGYLRNGVVNNQSAFTVSNDGKIQKMTIATKTMINDGTFPHAISDGHASYVGDDCCNYYANVASVRTLMFFYSYNDATDWNVGAMTYPSTFDDDYMSTVPVSAATFAAPINYMTGGKGYPHPLIVADDDILYMGDRNFIHAYDGATGATGTFYPAVLTLPQGFIITSFAKTNDRKLAIAGYFNTTNSTGADSFYLGKSLVWIWNLLDLDPDFSYDLHDNYVSEVVNWDGNIAAFTQGAGTLTSNARTKLQVLQNGDFAPISSWEIPSQNGIPIRGGVDTSQDEIYWNANGFLCSYTKNPYNGQYIYNQLTSGDGTSSGMLKILTGSSTPVFFLSSGATTAGGLQSFTDQFAPAASVYPKAAYPDFPERKRGRLKKITINYKSTASGGLLFRVNTVLDKTDARVAFNDVSTITNLKQLVMDTDANDLPLGDFTSIQPQLIWSSGLQTDSPVVESIIYDFENINI